MARAGTQQRVAHACRANAPALGGACYKQNTFALFYESVAVATCLGGGCGRLGYYRCERRNMAGETPTRSEAADTTWYRWFDAAGVAVPPMAGAEPRQHADRCSD